MAKPDRRPLGAIASVVGSSEDPKTVVEKMLQALQHRGKNMSIAALKGSLSGAIGYSSDNGSKSHFVNSFKTVIAMDGSFFQRSNGIDFLRRRMAKGSIYGAISRIELEPGIFAVLASTGRRLYAFRDLNGMKPLYFARKQQFVALASERKALWRIGFKEVNRILPGYAYSVGPAQFKRTQILQFKHPSEKLMTIQQASSQLNHLLRRSIQRIVRGVSKVGVAFSGGLDSAVTAALAKDQTQVELVSVGLEGSSELSTSERYARELGLPVTVETYDPDSLEAYVRRIVWLIEEPNLMKVSIAVPLHWASMVAARRGLKVMLCGQGSDELYGGYYKYARTLDSKGRRALEAELFRSVVEASQVNYERDEQATAPSGVELRTPFADRKVIAFSLTVPSDYKVKAGNDVTRKWVLRSVAKDLGLPEEMVWRRKKAIQHGTGVENAIRKLAKRKGMTAESYLASVFAEVRTIDSMP